MKPKSKDQHKFMTNGNMIPPDGKYGWIIVLSYAIANVSNKERKRFSKNFIFENDRLLILSRLFIRHFIFQKTVNFIV